MTVFLRECLEIFLESAPWLVLGFGFAGLTKVFLDEDRWLGRSLARGGMSGAAMGAVLGAPLPLCSCSVLPAAIGLRRQGASRSATASFLVSVPETDVASVMITWGLLGPVMAVARPVAAVATALGTGWAVGALAPDPRPVPAPEEVARPETDCCCPPGEAADSGPAWRRALHYGYVEFLDDIAGPLVLGIVLAGAIGSLAAAFGLESWIGGSITGYLVALAVGIPTYVCATASTPVAVGMLAAGMSPGAVLVFLLAGPATNVASFVVLGRELGRRGLVVYIAAIAVGSVAFGLAFDLAFGQDFLAVPVASTAHHEGSTVWQIGSGLLLAALLISSAVRQRWIVRRFTRS